MDMILPINVKPSAFLRALAEQLDRGIPATTPRPIPRVGDDWPEQGGRFVGVIRDGIGERAVIVCTDKAGDFADGPWGSYGTELAGTKDDHDGRGNTKELAEAGNKHAAKVFALQLGGHNDWYIPSRQELALCFMHAKDLFNQEWYWSSTQYSSGSAWGQGFGSGGVDIYNKDFTSRVRAVRTIPL